MQFETFPKIPRLSREIVITEKIDGTNAQVVIASATDAVNDNFPIEEITATSGDYVILAGSRNRYVTPSKDNFGFAKWVSDNAQEIVKLGPGRHFGEWWGPGIQRGYGLAQKKFSLFNVKRWGGGKHPEARPAAECCSLVPVLYNGPFSQDAIDDTLAELTEKGSLASPGFMRPEGIVVFHAASNTLFKKTIDNDNEPKSLAA